MFHIHNPAVVVSFHRLANCGRAVCPKWYDTFPRRIFIAKIRAEINTAGNCKRLAKIALKLTHFLDWHYKSKVYCSEQHVTCLLTSHCAGGMHMNNTPCKEMETCIYVSVFDCIYSCNCSTKSLSPSLSLSLFSFLFEWLFASWRFINDSTLRQIAYSKWSLWLYPS